MYQLPANRTKVLPWLCVLSDWFNQITPSLINEAFTKGIKSIWIVWKTMSRCVTILTKLELKFKKYFLVSKFSLDYLGYQFLYASCKWYSNPWTFLIEMIEIEPMASAPWWLLFIIKPRHQLVFGVGEIWTQTPYATIRDFTSWANWNPQQPLNINWDVLTDTHISECKKIRILVDLDKLYFFFFFYHHSIQISFIFYCLID